MSEPKSRILEHLLLIWLKRRLMLPLQRSVKYHNMSSFEKQVDLLLDSLKRLDELELSHRRSNRIGYD